MENNFIVKWKGYRETELVERELLIEDVPKIVKKFEKDHKVKWTKTKVSYI